MGFYKLSVLGFSVAVCSNSLLFSAQLFRVLTVNIHISMSSITHLAGMFVYIFEPSVRIPA